MPREMAQGKIGKTTTSDGGRRVVRYRNPRNGWYLDLDNRWPMPDADRNRYRVFYGPGVLCTFASRREAFAAVRKFLLSDTFVPCPFDNGVRARFREALSRHGVTL